MIRVNIHLQERLEVKVGTAVSHRWLEVRNVRTVPATDDQATIFGSNEQMAEIAGALLTDRQVVDAMGPDVQDAIRAIVRSWDYDEISAAHDAGCPECARLYADAMATEVVGDSTGTPVIPTPGDRFTVSGPTNAGGFIVRDNATYENAAFGRHTVQLTYGEYDRALTVAQRLNAAAAHDEDCPACRGEGGECVATVLEAEEANERQLTRCDKVALVGLDGPVGCRLVPGHAGPHVPQHGQKPVQS